MLSVTGLGLGLLEMFNIHKRTGAFVAVSSNLGNPEHLDCGDAWQSYARWLRGLPNGPEPSGWWFLLPAVGLAIELEDGVGVSWDGREVHHCTAVPHGIGEGDELFSMFFSVQRRAEQHVVRQRHLLRALGVRGASRVEVGDSVWVKWYPEVSDRKSDRFRCVRGFVREISGSEILVRGKFTHEMDVWIPWQLVVRAGAVSRPVVGPMQGPTLVGQRVWVYWPAEDELFPGVVSAWDSVQCLHTVSYDDGDVCEEQLSGEGAPYWYVES